MEMCQSHVGIVCFSLELICGCAVAGRWCCDAVFALAQTKRANHTRGSRGCPDPCTGFKVIRELILTCEQSCKQFHASYNADAVFPS